MSADRAGCCANWPKECSYHEGYLDALGDVADKVGQMWTDIDKALPAPTVPVDDAKASASDIEP